MRKIGYIIAAACVAALCFVLVGCGGGGGGSAAPDYTKNFVGTYELTSMEQNGQVAVDESTMQMMKQLGATVTLELKDDKTFLLKLESLGQSDESGNWTAKSATEAELSVGNNETIKVELNDKKIILTEDGSDYKMTFTLIEE